MLRYQAAFIASDGKTLAVDSYSARSMGQAVAFARRRAPTGAARVVVAVRGF